MTTFVTTVGGPLISQWYQYAGGPAVNLDATPNVTITNLTTSAVVLGPTTAGVTNPATGVYHLSWNAAVTPDNYLVVWNGLSGGDAVQASEIVNVLAVAEGSGPCTWTGINTSCAPDWSTYAASFQEQALAYATLVLWAATGRQYGECPVTVYPCGRDTAGDVANNGAWGWWWDYGTWVPYIWQGEWFNACGCGLPGCWACKPKCAAYLPGPVSSIIQVTLDGVVLSPSEYRVWDQQWLTRINDASGNAQCWPACQDYNAVTPAFEVIYNRGTPVPSALLNAAGTLAGEFAKACLGQQCQLPSRVVNIARQGVTVNLTDIDTLLEKGFTGITSVDAIIAALNPNSIKGRTRLFSFDTPVARVITS